VELVISDTARIVMKEELGDKGDRLIFERRTGTIFKTENGG